MDFRFGSKYGSNMLENIISHKKCAQMIEPIFDCLTDEELKTAFYSLNKAQQDILDTIISASFIKKRMKKSGLMLDTKKLRPVEISNLKKVFKIFI